MSEIHFEITLQNPGISPQYILENPGISPQNVLELDFRLSLRTLILF